MYKVNDYIMYKRDVCIIKEVKKINDNDYYILIPVSDNSLTISVPTNKDDFIRNLITKKQLDNIIDNIPNIQVINVDNRLYENEYRNLLNTGLHEDLIKIIKTTYLRNKERLENNKKIGDKDNHYFEMAEKFLYNEFSIVLGLSYEDTKKYVSDKLKTIK